MELAVFVCVKSSEIHPVHDSVNMYKHTHAYWVGNPPQSAVDMHSSAFCILISLSLSRPHSACLCVYRIFVAGKHYIQFTLSVNILLFNYSQ